MLLAPESPYVTLSFAKRTGSELCLKEILHSELVFFSIALPTSKRVMVMVGSVSVDRIRVRTSCGRSVCCAPAVSGQDFMLRSLGDCYHRITQPGMVRECQ